MLKNISFNRRVVLSFAAAATIVILGIGLVFLASKSASIGNLIVTATTRQPETFTELYFKNSANLPKIIKTNQTYSFTFTIHNLENKDVLYPYAVYIKRGDLRAVVAQGTIAINNNDFKSVNVEMGPLSLFRKEVVVELTGKNQAISFWMDTQ